MIFSLLYVLVLNYHYEAVSSKLDAALYTLYKKPEKYRQLSYKKRISFKPPTMF